MNDQIFLLHDSGSLLELTEQSYDSEELLQIMLSDYPDLLAGAQINPTLPRRWLLVTREAGVASDDTGANRWSVDHLFLDQDGIPTLVEVKRSSDTRIRREVIGQMLDYAANAVVYWPVEQIQSYFSRRCENEGLDPEQLLAEFSDDTGAFWQRVSTNLQAGRIRLLFVADIIPPELRRVVEYLNQQMNPTEVLALEIKQFVGQGLKTLVPRVIGQTEEAQQKKGSTSREIRQWDETSFFDELINQRGQQEANVARAILEWGRREMPRIWWGRGKTMGSFIPILDWHGASQLIISVWTTGAVELQFQHMKAKPPFNNETLRKEWLDRINKIPGLSVPDDRIDKRPSIPLSPLCETNALEDFLKALDWAIKQIKTQ